MTDNDEVLWSGGLGIVRKLEHSGFQAYLVGGCVRDKLIGRSLHDIDIATSAKPEEVMATFARTLPTGLKHGTVTVMEAGRAYEVTTFRRESDYSDSRRPDEVEFVLDIVEDLSRRDFTFNAMAFGSDGMIVDPFGGQDALRAGVVDCVGDPSERFGEDALRMLRAIRFASEFEFALLPDVWEGIIQHRQKLRNVAMERVSAEWDKMMSGSGPEQANHFLFKSGLLAHTKEALPDSVKLAAERYRLNGSTWEWDKWGQATSEEASLGNLLQLPMLSEPDHRWAALLMGAGINEEDGAELFRSLRFSGKRSDRITGIMGINEMLSVYDENSVRTGWVYAVLDYGRAAAEDWCTVNEILDETLADARKWLKEMPVVSVSELNVRGDELARSLDKPPGPWIATLLEELLEEVAFGSIPNDKDSLLSAAKQARGTSNEQG